MATKRHKRRKNIQLCAFAAPQFCPPTCRPISMAPRVERQLPELDLRVSSTADNAAQLFRQGFASCFRGEPDEDQTEEVNQRDYGARLGVTAAVVGNQLTLGERPGGRENPAGVIADALTGGADSCGKQFRQIEREPSIKRRGRATHQKN